MKLIDRDKLQRTEGIFTYRFTDDTDILSCCAYRYEDIETAPTIKAIPIEWLHNIMEKQLIFAMESEMEGTTTVKDGVIHCVSGALACQVLANVIELWEKENGLL